MHRAFSTIGCPSANLEEVFEIAQRNNIEAVELRALGDSVDLPTYFTRHFGRPSGLREFMQSASVKITAIHTTSFRLMGPREPDRDILRRYLPWADALGGVPLRVLDGGTKVTKAELRRACSVLSWWREEREAEGAASDLIIETHHSLTNRAALERFMDVTSPDTALLWDAHQTWRNGGESPASLWPVLKERVTHVHVRDSINEPGVGHPFTYVLPGDGEFPMAELTTELERDGFAGTLCLDWELLWHSYLPPIDEALAEAKLKHWW